MSCLLAAADKCKYHCLAANDAVAVDSKKLPTIRRCHVLMHQMPAVALKHGSLCFILYNPTYDFRVKRNTSHVNRHISHITHHTSQSTRHVNAVTVGFNATCRFAASSPLPHKNIIVIILRSRDSGAVALQSVATALETCFYVRFCCTNALQKETRTCPFCSCA